jgi:hypothetical protein
VAESLTPTFDVRVATGCTRVSLAATQMSDGPKLDVALSFMMADIALPRRLYLALSETLKVFFFERSQEELTGRHGDEVFRTPFLDARVSVVFFREGYGEKGWTGVERTAIGEACLANGYRNLFVVATEPKPKLSAWIPSTHIRFSLDNFPEEQLIGAIRSKVLELGGQPQPMTSEKRVKLLKENQRYEADKRRFWQDGLPIMQREVEAIFEEIARKVGELDQGPVKSFDVGYNERWCVVRDKTVSLKIRWDREGYGSIETDELKTEEYEAPMELPGEARKMWWDDGPPKSRGTNAYLLELSRSRRHLWREKHEWRGRPTPTDLSSTALADRLVIQFFELIERFTKERNRRGR